MQHRGLSSYVRSFLVGTILLISALYSSGLRIARAQAPGIVLVPGTVTLSSNVNDAILAALESASALFPGTPYFAVTDWRQDGRWAVASVLGVSQLRNSTWSIDDAAWTGLVLLHQSQGGAWHAATQGTTGFSSLIAASPDSFLSASARRDIDPLQTPTVQAQATSSYIFPLQPGSLMYYGGLGVHDNGFKGVTGSIWKAVDLLSDGDESQNHAPNRLLASQGGTITYKCKDSNNVAVRIGNFFYTHLINNASLVVGASFIQGDVLGQLKTGKFGVVGEGCGWADQPSNWFHVHWGFPNADLQIEDWTLSMSTGNWTNGTSTVTPGHWMLAGPTPPMPANLTETSATQNVINFAWDPSPGADGYHIYSLSGSSYTLLATVPSTPTSYTEIRFACGWSQDYKVSAYNYIGDSPRAGPLHAVTIPCDPSPLGPANGSSNRWNYDVTFQSSSAAGAGSYVFEYWGGPYTTPQSCQSSTASCHVGILPPGGTYSWHVKASSAAGATAWSPVWSFTIQPLPCYTLTVAHTGGGTDPVATPSHSSGCSAEQYHPTEKINFTAAPDTGWKVGSWSGTDNDSSTSTSNALTMPDGNATSAVNYTPIVPGVPVLVSPVNGATNQPVSLTLTWNAADGAVSYDYCISTSGTCALWMTTGSGTSAALTDLSYGTLYYWWVRATNIYGNTSVSDAWHFKTGSKPGAFGKSSPANGAVSQPANTVLKWAASTGAVEYQYCMDTVNDGLCQGDNWISTGTKRTVDLTGKLSILTTYYWQVRAINTWGVTNSSGGWWAFTTSGVPGAFRKKLPASLSVNVPVRPTLSWSPSVYATGYEYCIDQTDDGACDGGSWIHTPAVTSTRSSLVLQPLTTYYWQVHALNGFGTAASNNDAWWSFTTGALPEAFSKIGPSDGAANQPLRLTLSWQPSTGASAYQYCLSMTKDTCRTWISTGTATSVGLRGLAPHTVYYWAVRTTNPIGTTYANAGAWWTFTTGYLPVSFSKLSPAKGATNVLPGPTLVWHASTYATSYEYCLSTTTPCTRWNSVGNVTSTTVSGLKAGMLYYWQVRARNNIGITGAAGGLWSFRVGYAPGSFSKSTPLNGSLNQPANVILTWVASSRATGYLYCIDATNNNVCDTGVWVSTGLTRSADLTSLGLIPNTAYYWQVRAVNSYGYRNANSGTWWTFKTAP